MKKEITYDDVPAEVWEVWAIETAGQPVGMTTWEWCNETIKKYPEWFPWEHEYDKVPKSVHDAYKKEAYISFDLFSIDNKEGFTGILPNLQLPEPEPERTLSETFAMLFRQEREARDRKEAEKKKAKAIWDKHYSKYGLEYRHQK